MANKYLDYTGLQHVINKVKALIKVTGVKGNAESTYRTGNVNLTAANVGSIPLDGNVSNINPVNNLNSFYTGIGLFNGVSNLPDTSSWWMVMAAGTSNTNVQVAYILGNSVKPKTRYCAGGTWSAWADLKTS